MNAAAYVQAALQLAPLLIQAGQDLKPFAEEIVQAIEGKPPTEADFALLKAKEAELLAVIDAPIPGDEP